MLLLLACAAGLSMAIQVPPPAASTESWWYPWTWYDDESARFQKALGPTATSTESWWYPWTWYDDEARIDIAQIRQHFLRSLGGLTAISCVIYLAMFYLGTPLAEKARVSIVKKFHLSTTAQRDAAIATYSVLWCATIGLAFFYKNLQDARVASLILLSGSLYPFAAKLLPGISSDDAALRKDGLREIKAILVLLVVVLLAFQIFTDGVAGIKVGQS